MTDGQTNDAALLAGKVALVTGGGSGIGRAAALGFAKKGASVVVAGRRQAELDAVVAEIQALGGKAAAITADISAEDDVKSLINEVVERFGRLDAAFNNAGIANGGPIEALTTADFDLVFSTNVRGVWMLIQQEVIAMRALGNGGAIVNTSSTLGSGGNAGASVYGSSKGALDSMVRHVALEVGGDGIRINNVSPGLTRTPMTDGWPDVVFSAASNHTALKRVAEPEEVGDVAVWLCTNEARFVTGQTILADGGYNIAGMR
jgi:NAD(P)-dependent dehydrogenase (short-subunit alcohol dehydrogenase family)